MWVGSVKNDSANGIPSIYLMEHNAKKQGWVKKGKRYHLCEVCFNNLGGDNT
jgi:hypothetical protein